MKILTESLLAFVLVLAVGCNKDKIEPTDTNTDFEVEASETIGPEGGSIETEGFVLTIPAGAFGSETELVLSSAVDKQTFGEYLVSRMFKIDGIPVEFSKPLKVKIRYEGTLSEGSYIASGEEVYTPSLDTLTNAFRLINATDSSGWLNGELPMPEEHVPSSGLKKKSTDAGGFAGRMLGAITSIVSIYSENLNFLIHYPLFLVNYSDAVALGDYLEEAYSFFENHFDLKYSDSLEIVQVNVMSFAYRKAYSSSAFGYYSNSYIFQYSGYLDFNSEYLQDRENIRLTAGHEFFHLVQYLYDKRGAFSKAAYPSNHQWFNDATAVWSEKYFTDETNFQSPIADGNQMSPFDGLHAGATLDPSEHGYGMAALIGYLTGIYGDEFIFKVYQSISEGMHVVDAISQHTSKPADWLEDFFRQYILGNLNVFGVNASFIFSNAHRTFTIKNKNDFDSTITDGYDDLSARLYRIDFEDESIDNNDEITIGVEGMYKNKTEITIFNGTKGANGKIEYVTNSTNDITIGNIKRDYIDKKSHMYVLVTNSNAFANYAGAISYFDLNVTMNKKMPPPDWDICSARIYVLGHFKKTSLNGIKEVDLERGFGNVYEGGFINNTTFRANYYFNDPDLTSSGEMEVVLNETQDTVVSFSFTEEATTSKYRTVTTLSGKNIPKNPNALFQNTYIVTGESICEENIISLSYERTRITEEGEDETLTDHTCTSNSWIEIWF